MTDKLISSIKRLNATVVSSKRQEILLPLIDYLHKNLSSGQIPELNFICTHNSRRSQMAQAWAQAASLFYGINVSCYSGGTEITTFHKNAVQALEDLGFEIKKPIGENPKYEVVFNKNESPLKMYSKMYDDDNNPKNNYAAIMTCSHADENCPNILGNVKRISVNYEDPKMCDDTGEARQGYLKRGEQIGSEMLYVFGQIKNRE